MRPSDPNPYDLIKRAFDILFSLCVLILISPLFLPVALLIKFTSPGPVFYSQKRIGKDKKPFFFWKFRTMYVNANLLLQELLKKDPNIRREWEKNWKLKEDPRITWIGKFLRKTSLDELPQFWNVLKGDMSIVGPRPALEDEISLHFKEKAAKILSVRPGITGLWQVSGRSFLSYSEKIRLNEQYVDTRSFSLDIRLIAKTIFVIFSSKGAY
jgi:undecaprenyl-phosphate galactose phosphotransferase